MASEFRWLTFQQVIGLWHVVLHFFEYLASSGVSFSLPPFHTHTHSLSPLFFSFFLFLFFISGCCSNDFLVLIHIPVSR